jgi:hypothetical protein
LISHDYKQQIKDAILKIEEEEMAIRKELDAEKF